MITIGTKVELISVDAYRDMILTAEEDTGLISMYNDKYNAYTLATGKTEGTIQSLNSSFVTLREMGNIRFPISTITEAKTNGGTNSMIGTNSTTGTSGTVFGTMVAANTTAAKTAARMTAGKIALKVAKEKLAPTIPLMLRGYIDSPIGDLVIANMLVIANKYTNGKYKVLGAAAEATTEAAYANVFESFKLDEFLSEIEGKLTQAGFTPETGEAE